MTGNALEIRLQQIADLAIKHGAEKMRVVGRDMVEHATQHYTPEDKENLNEAIFVGEERGERRRVEVFVDIDLNAPGSGGADTVREYALNIHKGLNGRGTGPYVPGPISRTKFGPQGGAGPDFMGKTMRDFAPKLEAILGDLFRRQFR